MDEQPRESASETVQDGSGLVEEDDMIDESGIDTKMHPGPASTSVGHLQGNGVSTASTAVSVPARAASTIALEAQLATWEAERHLVEQFIARNMKEGQDFGKIHVSKNCKTFQETKTCQNPAHFSKDSLWKPGSEKIMGLLQLRAVFTKDVDTWDLLGCPQGTICYVCTLITRGGEVVAEGRGARDSAKDYGDINKSIKMAEKSSQIDAVLRMGTLSDFYTQDMEDMTETGSRSEPVIAQTPAQLRQRIMSLLQQLPPDQRTAEGYKTFVRTVTGLELVPAHFAEILRRLEYHFTQSTSEVPMTHN